MTKPYPLDGWHVDRCGRKLHDGCHVRHINGDVFVIDYARYVGGNGYSVFGWNQTRFRRGIRGTSRHMLDTRDIMLLRELEPHEVVSWLLVCIGLVALLMCVV